MKEKIFNFLLWLWSLSPILSFTKDDNYGELTINSGSSVRLQLREWRLSVLQIMLGAHKLYVLSVYRTVDPNTHAASLQWNWIRLLSLKEVCDNSNHIQQIYTDYYNRLNGASITDERLEAEKESLCYHIENENSRVEVSDNKMNIYSTVVLTILPILLSISFDSILELFKINLIYKIVIILALYFIINITLYLYWYLKVGSYSTSSFADLKNEPDGTLTKRLVSQYYYDFQSKRSKARLFVSYVINTQRWMVASFVLFIAAFTYHQCYTHSVAKQNNTVNSNSSIYNVYVSELKDPYSQSSISLTDIRKSIQTQSADKIIVMYNDQTDISDIESELKTFDSTFEIQYLYDNQLETNDAKILVYRGRTP